MVWPFSAIATFIIIIAAYSLLYVLFNRKFVAIPFIFVVVALAVLAYYITPNDTDDLTRYFNTLEYLKTGGRELLQSMKDADMNTWGDFPVYAEYFYWISRLPSVHYLPAVTILIVYSLMFLVLYKAANRFQVNKFYLYIGSMFFLSTYWYYDTLSGVRNGIVYAVVIACAYYHLVEKKNKILCYIGYVLACLMHSAGIIPVAIVFVVAFTKNIKGKYISPIMFFGITFGAAGLNYLSDITNNSFFQFLATKAERNSSVGGVMQQTTFYVNITILAVAISTVWYLSWYFKNSEKGLQYEQLFKYFSITIFFMIGCILHPLVFLRSARWIMPILIAVTFMTGMQIQRDMIEKEPDRNYYLQAPSEERSRYQSKGVFTLLFCIYTGVHFYYLCAGSSLNWLHF